MEFGAEFRSFCTHYLRELHQRLVLAFPNAKILLIRGHHMLLIFNLMSLTPFVICSASTFCLYAALGNTGRVLYPMIPAFLNTSRGENDEEGVVTLSATPSLGDGFQWITNPRLVYQSPGRSVKDIQRAVGMLTARARSAGQRF